MDSRLKKALELEAQEKIAAAVTQIGPRLDALEAAMLEKITALEERFDRLEALLKTANKPTGKG